MAGRTLEYPDADRTHLGYLALPERGEPLPERGEVLPERGEVLPERGEALPERGEALPERGEVLPERGEVLPAVLVFPDAGGVSGYACAVGDRLAALGYCALVVDPYGGGRRPVGLEQAMSWARALREDRPEWRRRARAAHAALQAVPQVDARRIAAIGYCMGGTACFELARSGIALAAIGTFHAGLNPPLPGDAPLGLPVLVQSGADDKLVPTEALGALGEELRSGGADWQIMIYGGTVHGFTNPEAASFGLPDRVRYNPAVDRRSWAALVSFFAEVLA